VLPGATLAELVALDLLESLRVLHGHARALIHRPLALGVVLVVPEDGHGFAIATGVRKAPAVVDHLHVELFLGPVCETGAVT